MVDPGAASSPGRPSGIVVLTRPAGQSASLIERLGNQGWRAYDWPALLLTGLPAIDVPDPSAFDLVVFVSGNAVRFYLGQLATVRGSSAIDWPQRVPTAAVGLGSAGVLRTMLGDGVSVIHPPADSALFDSEALWAEMQARGVRPERVLIVRGGRGCDGHGRDWLSQTLAQAGADVTLYAAYRRAPAVWPTCRLRQLRAWGASGLRPVWLLSSREGVEAVVSQLGRATALQGWIGCRVVVTHPRVAEAVTGFAESCGVATRRADVIPAPADSSAIVIQVSQPHDDAVLAAIVN